MFEIFENYITSLGSVTKEELALIRAQATEKKIHRRQFLLQEGEVCRHKVFVASGLLRTYRVKDDGTEHVMRFAPENSWSIDPESFHTQTPSKYNIEALEDSRVIMWSREAFMELFVAIPALKQLSEKVMERSINESQNRIFMNISYTAEEKYEAFIRQFPHVFTRVPLHMVASYLGVSRETLSRVRHSQLKRVKEC
jgi:CRP-like cAMP-binding protein